MRLLTFFFILLFRCIALECVAASDLTQLPYKGSETLCINRYEWNIIPVDFKYTCCDFKNEFWGGETRYSENRTAIAVEKNNRSQMFYYAVIPDNIYAMSDHYPGIGANIKELCSALSTFTDVQFFYEGEGKRNFVSLSDYRWGHYEEEIEGSCYSESLGKGFWQGKLYRANAAWHIVLSVSFNGLDNAFFFQTIHTDFICYDRG